MGHVYLATGPNGDGRRAQAAQARARCRTPSRAGASRARRTSRCASTTRTSSRVLDVGEHDGIPYLAQRYVQGGTLADKIDREGPLRAADAVAICTRRGRGARRPARGRARPPRPEAGEHPPRRARDRLHHGLRARQGPCRQRPHPPRPGARLARLHGAGADPGRHGRPRDRRLRPRLRDVHVPVRRAAVRRPPRHGACCGRTCRTRRTNPVANRPDIPDALGEAVLRALEKEPEDRPQTATDYALLLQAAVG